MLDVAHGYENDSLVGGEPKKTCIQRFKYPLIALIIIVVALAIIAAVVLSARLGNNKSWDELVQTNNIMGHLQQLQNIANQNNGNRAAGTSGYNASVAYIVGQLEQHGYTPVVQPFPIETLKINNISNLTIAAEGIFFNNAYPTDFIPFGAFNGTHDVLDAPVYTALSYGCNATDYPNVTGPNYVIVIKRGLCDFMMKVDQALKFEPACIIIYNEGNTPDRLGVFSGGGVSGISVPVFATSYFLGVALTSLPNTLVSVNISTESVTTYTMNVIAETKAGRADRVVLVGSHLDSVPAGPGINDNGSGSALNIELAIQLAASEQQKKIKNKIRFCWWGAEEIGLVGSTFYVTQLNSTNQTALHEIAVNLNFDMIGSPNFFRGVYNGSSDENGNGSAVVQRLFDNYYNEENIATEPTEFSGRSDYGPFLDVGIPAGGLFTGAEVVKTMQERIIFGGLAGASYDPCYHQACDNIDNINQDVLGDMATGAASVLQSLATQDDLATYLTVL